jgi:hypothetical protein
MVWSEYREEANIHDEQASDSCGDGDEDNQTMDPLDPEDWQDWHSQDLLNMWFSIRQYVETYGLQNEFLQLASFNDFCSFVYDFSIKSRQV